MIREGRAPDQGLQSCAQLAEGEGLDQVVVGPGVQPGYPVIDRPQGRQHQHGRLEPRRAHGLNNFQTRQAGHHSVRDNGVIGAVNRHVQARVAILGFVNRMALLPQALRHKGASAAVVVND
ncbi:hypothetical protein D3C87_1720970 [compost metagenome]